MKLSLMVLSEGKASGKAIPIHLSQFIIGRDPQCQLRPTSAVISKRHCALLSKNGKFYVRDFDSTNGTFVNDEQVKGEVELKNQDALKVGPLMFRVMIEGAVPVNKPTPLPKVPSDGGDDESVAAMLLDLADEGGAPLANSADGVPEGSTVMEIPSPFADQNGQAGEAKAEEAGKAGTKAPEKKKEMGNTSEAAAAILQKYARRQRT
jgi:predicted component of type VI protein secretion system